MSFLKSFGERQAIKLIKNYTGQDVTPTFICSSSADIKPDWRGVIVLDTNSLWLVNRLGARGVHLNRLRRGAFWGQFPQGTRGFPHYVFSFETEGELSFSIFPTTEDDGLRLKSILENLVEPKVTQAGGILIACSYFNPYPSGIDIPSFKGIFEFMPDGTWSVSSTALKVEKSKLVEWSWNKNFTRISWVSDFGKTFDILDEQEVEKARDYFEQHYILLKKPE